MRSPPPIRPHTIYTESDKTPPRHTRPAVYISTQTPHAITGHTPPSAPTRTTIRPRTPLYSRPLYPRTSTTITTTTQAATNTIATSLTGGRGRAAGHQGEGGVKKCVRRPKYNTPLRKFQAQKLWPTITYTTPTTNRAVRANFARIRRSQQARPFNIPE